MSQHQLHFSRDGSHWTPGGGLQHGVPTIGVIQPSSNRTSDQDVDVIVIGAGYAGLIAARDLTMTGHRVLLLEARDRIGGRTCSTDIEGYPYELGGTWVHWHQPFTWKELARYGMTSSLEASPVTGQGLDQSWIHCKDGSVLKLTHDEEFELLSGAMKKFMNIDGKNCREAMPFPYDPHRNPVTTAYDNMSFADRMDQIKSELTDLEIGILETFLPINTGGTMENSSFLDMIRWWAVNNYDMGWYNELCLTYKLKEGQSKFARYIFDEALETGRLSYQFNVAIASIQDNGSHVVAHCRTGRPFKAKRLVTTIPLNVLSTIQFSPPLLTGKQTAAELGHVNHNSKVHCEVANPDLRSFSGWMYNKPLGFAFGDGTTPAGNTHVVAFGPSFDGVKLNAKANNGEDAINAMRAFAPDQFVDLKRIVFHDWNEDEFSKGTWEFLSPNMATKYLDALRQRQGNVLFASADWATGWRGFIDGAIEEGGRVAKELNDDFKGARRLGLGVQGAPDFPKI